MCVFSAGREKTKLSDKTRRKTVLSTFRPRFSAKPSPFFSLSFFFLSYEHSTRGRFTFEFNNDINFCSLFFFLSSFSFFFLFFSSLFRCCSTLPGVNVEKISDSSFPDPFSPGEKLINGWEKWNGHS